MDRVLNLINGRFVEAAAGGWLDVIEPATGQPLAKVADSDSSDAQQAVVAAGEAFGGWAAMAVQERSGLLLRLADLIERDLERLARAESIDTGKPIALARTVDIPRAAANLRFFATAILHTQGRMHESDLPGPGGAFRAMNYTLRRPRGVAGLISPWNLPLYLLTWKVAPALATGNTVVCKPSEVTPMTAAMFGELAGEAGVPAGVVNIVHGRGKSAGAAIVQHPDVPTISFTGSTRVGQWIGRTAGGMLKRVSLELGGKNPFIVFADADMDRAMDEACRAAFSNQGQICLCGSRLLVEAAVYERFLEGLVARARALRIGDPLDERTQIGSLISASHRERVASYVEMARGAGGVIHCGGGAPTDLPERCAGGCFFEPTVVTDLPGDCPVLREEVFGPVVTVQAFSTEDEAVALANGTDYGLAGVLWTNDLARVHRVADRIEAGIVWINCWMARDLRTPFGGMKRSGVGREGGSDAIRFFTEAKNVCIRL